MKSGIYKIINLSNLKFYIGSSKNIQQRWLRHLKDLKNNCHHNIHLQRSFNKYGIDNFHLEIIEATSDLLNREQYYLDLWKPYYPTGYNIGVRSSGGDNISNHPNKEDIKQKISTTMKKRYQNESIDKKNQRSEKVKGKLNPNFGKKWSESQRQKASNFRKDKKMSSDTRHKMSIISKTRWQNPDFKHKMKDKRKGINNSFYGKKHTENSKKLIRDKQKLRYEQMTDEEKIKKIPNMRKVSINNTIYNSVTEAARHLKVVPATILYRIKSKNSKFINYKYV